MTFVQLEFLAFFAIVFPAYWMVGRREWQNAILCVSSAVFYGWVHPWFLGLLGFSAVLDFISGRAMEDRPKQKGTWLTISLIGNLGMLGFFKYYNFFVDNFAAALGKLGVLVHLPTLQIALPVGISFYTFQTLSYTIDVYRGRLKARRNWLDYLTFILMFPHLVAGPVMKAVDLLPQLEQTRTFDWGRLRSGLTLCGPRVRDPDASHAPGGCGDLGLRDPDPRGLLGLHGHRARHGANDGHRADAQL